MSRFVKIDGQNINVDFIRSYCQLDGQTHVTLNDGTKLIEPDIEIEMVENMISGAFHIVQIIPCVKPMMASFNHNEDNSRWETEINFLAVMGDGTVSPLTCLENEFIPACNYLSDELEMIGEKENW